MRLPSLRALVTGIVCVPVAVACALLVVIATGANRRVAGELRDQLLEQASASVAAEARNYVEDAMQVSDVYVRQMEAGRLDERRLEMWEGRLFDDLATHPRVASICFGREDGAAVWLLRAHGRLELGIAHAGAEPPAIEYPADVTGRVDRERPIREYVYDARKRPWYGVGSAAAREGRWTPVYFWFGGSGTATETGVGYARAVFGRDGKQVGVLVVDITLGALSDFLRHVPLARRGEVYIVDDTGMLVAASQGAVNSEKGERLALAAGLIRPSGAAPARVKWNGVPAWVTVTQLAPHPGVNWRVVTVLPEQAFMATVSATQRNSVALAVVCGVGALLLAMRFGERLTRPLVELANHVVKVGKGDFDSRLELEGAKELREVSRQVNRMAAGLRERMELQHSISLAKHVQQSLLPAGPPQVAGLELFGQSQYCDATGGDYYDFIDVSELPAGTGVMVAVGDVTGHGIGSALVMATARAALRSTMIGWAGKSLGEVLCKVNRVLAEDARHGLFMTMVLMEIDVAGRRLRWASAGHEPAILYDPVADTFEELMGGDIPLGIEGETEYVEYTRGIAVNDRLMVIGTDGIWEARNGADEMFGRERLRNVMRATVGGTAEQVAAGIMRALEAFTGGKKYKDDVTFVVVKLKAE